MKLTSEPTLWIRSLRRSGFHLVTISPALYPFLIIGGENMEYPKGTEWNQRLDDEKLINKIVRLVICCCCY